MHINPDLLDSVSTTPLLRPVPTPIADGGKFVVGFSGCEILDFFVKVRPNTTNELVSFVEHRGEKKEVFVKINPTDPLILSNNQREGPEKELIRFLW